MIKKIWPWIFVLLLGLPVLLTAQTWVPAGKVGGQHWTREGSPYLIQGDIIVDKDSTLTIGPGVQVIFQGYYSLRIAMSCVRALGTYNDSILFTVQDTTGYYNRSFTGWNGLHFLTGSSQDTSVLDHVIIKFAKVGGIVTNQNSGAGIYAENFDKLKILHSSIRNNLAISASDNQTNASASGAGLSFTNSQVFIESCKITDNEIYLKASSFSFGRGAGMEIFNCVDPIRITHSVFSNNRINSGSTTASEWAQGGGLSAVACENLFIYGNSFVANTCLHNFGSGGGIYMYGSNALIENNRFIENISNYDGGGVELEASLTVKLIGNLFFHNMTAFQDGAGLDASSSESMSLVNNTFVNNSATGTGGGIHMWQGFNMINCIFKGNSPDQISLTSNGYNDTIQFCNIENGMNGISVYENDPPGYPYQGIISGLTQSDPMFTNIQQRDVTLLSGSPCINAGNPDTTGLHLPEFCLNGIIRIEDQHIDIGAFEFTSNQPPYDLQPSAFEVQEDQAAGLLAVSLQTFDPDSAESFTYSFNSEVPASQDNGKFYISGNQLYTAEPLDYEVDSALQICLVTTDSRGHSFQKNLTVKVLDINDPPILLDTIPDISVMQGSSSLIQLNPQHFYDQDLKDSLTFSLELVDNQALPSWVTLSADHFGMMLEFCPLLAEPLYWKLTACDQGMACVSDEFTLTVIPAGFSGENNFMVFPNPGGEFIRIQYLGISDAPVTINLFDFTGQKVGEEILDTPQSTGMLMDVSTLSNGMYFIQFTGKDFNWVKPWVKL